MADALRLGGKRAFARAAHPQQNQPRAETVNAHFQRQLPLPYPRAQAAAVFAQMPARVGCLEIVTVLVIEGVGS